MLIIYSFFYYKNKHYYNKKVTGVIRKTNLTSIKLEVYPNCRFNNDGNSTNNCNKQEKSFNNTLFNGQLCGDLTGECDASVGLSCQKVSGVGKCSYVFKYCLIKKKGK